MSQLRIKSKLKVECEEELTGNESLSVELMDIYSTYMNLDLIHMKFEEWKDCNNFTLERDKWPSL
jgi:hypothetical protein